MNVTFLGHQSWLIESGTTRVLVDPLLQEGFGSATGFRVYPLRSIDMHAVELVDAVVLSHEHTDHFDLASLSCLPRSIVIYIGVLMTVAVEESLRALGFRVERIYPRETLEIGDLLLDLYASGKDTAFWESRVYQVLVQSKHDPMESIFIAVDALISEEFIADVQSMTVEMPRAIAVSNNSQIAPRGVFGSLDNLAIPDAENRQKNGLVGLETLQAIIVDYLHQLPPPEYVMICGGGFLKGYEGYGPFHFSDQDVLGEVASALCLRSEVDGPVPGDTYALESGRRVTKTKAPWLRVHEEESRRLRKLTEDFCEASSPCEIQQRAPSFGSEAEYEAARLRIEGSLIRLARALPFSDMGKHVLTLTRRNGALLMGRRIAIQLRGGSNLDGSGNADLTYVYDCAAGKFLRDVGALDLDSLIDRFPFGFHAHVQDFAAVVDGDLQIWDIAGTGARSWYEGDMFGGVLPLLYTFFGENVSVSLARKTYNRQLMQLRAGT